MNHIFPYVYMILIYLEILLAQLTLDYVAYELQIVDVGQSPRVTDFR